MKIQINKARLALSLISLGALLVIGSLLAFAEQERQQIIVLTIKLAKQPVTIVKLVTPTASPTAELKLNTKTGVVR